MRFYCRRRTPRTATVVGPLLAVLLGVGLTACSVEGGRTTTTAAGMVARAAADAGPGSDGAAAGRRPGSTTSTGSFDLGPARSERTLDPDLMPDLAGAPLAEARRMLAGAVIRLVDRSGLDLDPATGTDALGIVCAQTPPAGARTDDTLPTLVVAASSVDC